MLKVDFLDYVRKGLCSLSEEDVERSIRYYSEMIDDRIEDGVSEEEAVAAMGEPEAVIAEILKESDAVSGEAVKEQSESCTAFAAKAEKSRKKRKILPIALAITLVLLLATAFLMLFPLIKSGFNKEKLLSGYGYIAIESDTSAVVGFDSINISEGIANVLILPSETEDCFLRFTSIDGIHRYCDIGNDDTLYITYVDERDWFEKICNMWYEEATVTLYLPHTSFYKLEIDSTDGSDVYVSEEFGFQYVEVNTSSGDIDFRANVGDINAELNAVLKSTSGDITLSNISKGGFHIETTSGDVSLNKIHLCERITINNSNIANELKGIIDQFAQSVGITVKTTSGEVQVNDVRSIELMVETVSGDIELDNVYNYIGLRAESTSGNVEAEEVISLMGVTFETTSGDISFEGLDSYAGIFFKSTSGDIFGDIDTNCYFSVKTASGTVNLPQNDGGSTSNGRPLLHCSVTTVSGDINIRTPE